MARPIPRFAPVTRATEPAALLGRGIATSGKYDTTITGATSPWDSRTPPGWSIAGRGSFPGGLADPDDLAAGRAQLRAHAGAGGDAAVGDVDRAVAPGGEAGRVEQLADARVGGVAPPVDAHHVAGRFGGRALVEPAGLELAGVERAVPAEAAALHGGQAGGPDPRGGPRPAPDAPARPRRVR